MKSRERQHLDDQQSDGARKPPKSPATSRDGVDGSLRELQSTAGNRAVTDLVSGSNPTIQGSFFGGFGGLEDWMAKETSRATPAFDGSLKEEAADPSIKEQPADQSAKMEEASTKWDPSEKVDPADKWDASQKLDVSDKWDQSEKLDASDKWDQSEKIDASDKWDQSQKLDASDKFDVSQKVDLEEF